MTQVICDNYRCKFNKDSICQKSCISINYYYEERDDSGMDCYDCESAEG